METFFLMKVADKWKPGPIFMKRELGWRNCKWLSKTEERFIQSVPIGNKQVHLYGTTSENLWTVKALEAQMSQKMRMRCELETSQLLKNLHRDIRALCPQVWRQGPAFLLQWRRREIHYIKKLSWDTLVWGVPDTRERWSQAEKKIITFEIPRPLLSFTSRSLTTKIHFLKQKIIEYYSGEN